MLEPISIASITYLLSKHAYEDLSQISGWFRATPTKTIFLDTMCLEFIFIVIHIYFTGD